MAEREGRKSPGAEGAHGHSHVQGDDRSCRSVARQKSNTPFDPNSLISARGLGISRNGRDLLIDVDLDIREGEIVTLIGPNGAGKTTLVRVLLGLEKPDRGEVHRRKDLRIGYVPQRFDVDSVIPLTVERFLRIGGNEPPERISAILSDVDASYTRDQQLTELSGGELQRVVLARALLRAPNLLVLDEPVQGVDYTGEAELYNLIGRLRDSHGFCVLLVSHDLHIVMAKSDRVICLNRHVCCSGVPDTVAQHPAYVRLFGAQAARALAVYRHHHDHSHDIAGHTHPAHDSAGEDPGAQGGSRA
ncbi:MAG: ATP-binding cassette domain-containing protein [Alphaproteobacteria bacterium]